MSRPTTTREILLETAIDLIWRSNYASVGVNEICKCAGVTKGGFYHHFETKADLFYEASMYHWQQKKKELDEIYSPSFTPLEQLENIIQFVIDWQVREQGDGNPVCGCPFFTSGAQVGTGEEKVREAGRKLSDFAVQYNTALVRGLKADGVLNSDCDPHQIGRMIQQYLQGLLLYGRVYYSLDAVRRDLRDGLYRLVDLKAEYRLTGEDPVMPAAAA